MKSRNSEDMHGSTHSCSGQQTTVSGQLHALATVPLEKYLTMSVQYESEYTSRAGLHALEKKIIS
jgi:hypothetical protein